MVYVVGFFTTGGVSYIAALISPTPRLLWLRGVGKWPDRHVLDALSASGMARGCAVGRPPPSGGPPPDSSGGGGQAVGVECNGCNCVYVGSSLDVMQQVHHC